jgi:hypothetical protein
MRRTMKTPIFSHLRPVKYQLWLPLQSLEQSWDQLRSTSRHSGIWWAVDEAVMNEVLNEQQKQQK